MHLFLSALFSAFLLVLFFVVLIVAISLISWSLPNFGALFGAEFVRLLGLIWLALTAIVFFSTLGD